LARDTVEGYVKDRKTPDPRGGPYAITPALREHRGAFVTLKAHGKLRGCIGYIQPIEPLYEAVRQNAINAATRDSRFRPVETDDLSTIQIEISVLTPPAPVSSYRDIVPGSHGIILKKGSHQAVFLPQVAPEQGWDLPETLRHLSLKAGLSGDDWKAPDAEFFVFTAEIIEEE
jgi:AmmeMemoRadiSam system protein A